MAVLLAAKMEINEQLTTVVLSAAKILISRHLYKIMRKAHPAIVN